MPRTDEATGLPVLDAEENPWGVTVFDCRGVFANMTSASSDPDIARRFVEGRASDGSGLVGAVLPFETRFREPLYYPAKPFRAQGVVVMAGQMEDKWDVFRQADGLYFTRSWTGELVYRTQIAVDGKTAYVLGIQSPEAFDPELAEREIDFLVVSYAFGMPFPHQLSPDLPKTASHVIARSWSHHGRRGCFPTYDDTLYAKRDVPWE